jgi:hypothetical protein
MGGYGHSMVCTWTATAPSPTQRVLANVTAFSTYTVLPQFCSFDLVTFTDPAPNGDTATLSLCGTPGPQLLASSSPNLDLTLITDLSIRDSGVTVDFVTLPPCTGNIVLRKTGDSADVLQHAFPTIENPGPCGWLVDVPFNASVPDLRASLVFSTFHVPCPSAMVVRVGGPGGLVLWRLCGFSPISTAPQVIPPGGLRLFFALTAPVLASLQVAPHALEHPRR